jgi:5-methylcytosine-specific restriction endonuclease McrA
MDEGSGLITISLFMKSELKARSLQKLADAYLGDELRVNKEYQRGTKWSLAQKQGLIDSLLRGYQIPLFYVHLEARTNNYTGGVEKTAWLVDGQQRLAAIVGYRQNEFSLPNAQKTAPGTIIPFGAADQPAWIGKKFDELTPDDKGRLLNRELLVVEMTADHPNEVRDLFIRLQAGTPLTAQEKRDAWPGDFTNFVIRHAGKPGHPLSNPRRFFGLFPRSRGLTVDDGDHYVDGLAEVRKFFAGLAMTIMVRERAEVDFVDLKGKTINDFYKDNLDLKDDDPGALRVIHTLDLVPQLPGFENLREGRALSFQWAVHLALLVDSLDEGNYSTVWREDVVNAFIAFKQAVADAQLHYRQNHESRPHYERFARLLSGSGSDTAEVIRNRHSYLLAEVYPKIRIRMLDPNRRFDVLEREVIWNRDRGTCQNPGCPRPARRVPFREATIHHVDEHTAGGQTVLQNGVLICPDCHGNRTEMQRLSSHFREYLHRIYTNAAQQIVGGPEISAERNQGLEQVSADNELEENGGRETEGRLKIVIDWGELDVDREPQTISEAQASDSVLKLLVEIIGAFGEPVKQQLTELPVIRYPLSRSPSTAFVNRAKGRPIGSLPVPGTDLYFCPLSGTREKVTRLKKLFSRLTLPDGTNFPSGSVEFSIDAL